MPCHVHASRFNCLVVPMMLASASTAAGQGSIRLDCPSEHPIFCATLRTEMAERMPGRLSDPDSASPDMIVTLVILHDHARELAARLDWDIPARQMSGQGPEVIASVQDADQLGTGVLRNLARGLLEVTRFPA